MAKTREGIPFRLVRVATSNRGDLDRVESGSRDVLRSTDAVIREKTEILCAVAGRTPQVSRAAARLTQAAISWEIPLTVELVPEPVPPRLRKVESRVTEGSVAIAIREPRGGLTPSVAESAELELARNTASALRARVDALEAENRDLRFGMGLMQIENERLAKAIADKRPRFRRS